MDCGVYQIKNTINGKRYIGSSNQVKRRFYLHKWDLRRGKHHSITLQRSWDKYGEQAFSFEPIIYCSVDDLHFYEQHCLDKVGTVDPLKGFNICCDASAAGKGRVWTDAQKKAKSIERKGKKVSPETLKKFQTCHQRGEDHHMFGKHHTKESRRKISDSKKGQTAWNKGKPQHPANSQAKITRDQAMAIRSRMQKSGCPRYSRALSALQREVGEEYGLKRDTVWKISTGRLWPEPQGVSI